MKRQIIFIAMLFIFQSARTAVNNSNNHGKSIEQEYNDAVYLIQEKGQYKKAKKKLTYIIHNQESQKTLNYHNLGSAYYYYWKCDKTKERANKAKEYLLKALANKDSLNYSNTKNPGTYCLLGELSLYLKDYKASISYYNNFLAILKKNKLDANTSDVYHQMSIAYYKENDYKNALVYIKLSLDNFPESNNLHQQTNRAGLSLFYILFLYKNNKKKEAKIQLNKLRIQLNKLPQDNNTVIRALKQCDYLHEKLNN